MPDVVVKHGDQELSVPLESLALPEGFAVLSSDELSAKYVERESVKKDYVPKSEFQRRLNSVTDHAHENETVVARVLEMHGKTNVPDLDAAKSQWESANLKPLKEKYSTLREGLKSAQIREIAKDYFDERFVNPLPGGSASSVELALARQFELDDTTAGIYPVGDDGKPLLAADPSSHSPHRTAREQFELLAKDPRWEPFLKQERRNAGGSGRPGQDGNVGGTVTRKSDIPDEQKAAWIKQHGLPKYRALKD